MPKTRFAVATDMHGQQIGTAMLADGLCGWRDARGALRAVGRPLRPEDRGRVWEEEHDE